MMIGGSTSTSTSTRELSLVEQKRLQWQKEREEIDRIGSEIFSHSQTNYEKTCIKTYFSNVDLSRSTSHFDEPVARNFQHFPATPQSSTNYNHYGFRPPIPTPAPSDQHTGARAMRSPSLPPIPREKYYNYNPNGQTLVFNPVHSDTGYHSESSPPNNDGPIQVWTNDDDGRGSNKTVTLRSRSRPEVNGRPHFQEAHQVQSINKPLATPNSLSSGQTFSTMSQSIPEAEFREGQQRRKWNDTPQSYFDPMTRSLDSRSSQNVPYWLEKGLHEMRDSEDESFRSSHIRGQNIPIDPDVMAERASRRRKALELQNAIKEQLMEQERLKKWEKEKRIQEEIMAEERLRKEVEAERQRLEFEKRVQEDKVENERRKAEFMRLAVEKAELEAKLERERRKKHVKAVEEVREEEVISKTVPEDVKAPTPVPFRGGTAAGHATETHNVPAQEIFANKPSEIDGIALVLQSITPINLGQPTAQQDLLGLNNSVNNLQFALLLAQQQQQLNMQAQQLNTISSASSLLSNATGEGTVPNTVRDGGAKRVLESNQSKILESTREDGDEGKECIYCCRIHGGHLRDRVPSSKLIDAQPEKEAEDKQRMKQFDNPPIIVQQDQPILSLVSRQDEEIEEEIIADESMALEVPKMPTDGTFIKEETLTLDTDTSTQTDGEISGFELVTWDKPRVLTPRKYRVSSASSKMLLSTSEVGIQTDLLLLENCNICTHKQLVLKEISQVTTSVTQTSSRKNYDQSPIRRQCVDEVKGDRELTTTTITTTTTIRAKTNERNTRHNKKEPRPKWGVNQPAFQYVKASDRDPFCLRRRKRGQLKSYSIEEDVVNYRHKADSGVSSHNGSVHSAEDTDKELDASTRRNMCTEILPIKTDGNGQVFVNFHEARLVQKDELTTRNVVPAQSHTGREKIMEKRSEDLPFIPSVFRTERKLTKSASVSNYFPSTTSAMGSPVSKGDKEELNLLKRNVEI